MDVKCNSCGAKIKVPKEKLPSNQTVVITCPKCREKIKINTKETARNDVAEGKQEPKQEEKKVQEEPQPVSLEEDTTPLEVFEEGAKLALLLAGETEHADDINSAVDNLDYKPVVCSSVREAMNKIRLHHFDLIMLSEGFDGINIDDSPVIHFLNHLPMGVRRKTFLVLSSDKFKTMDNMMAFVKSANLVINPADLPKLELILKNALSDHQKFYKVFMDTLKEIGKE